MGEMSFKNAVFQASDLAGSRRREFITAAREGRALLRDTDGFALAMLPLAELDAVAELSHTAAAFIRAESALQQGKTRPVDLGDFAWLSVFEDDDRAELFGELRDAISMAESTHDLEPLRTCLREWQTTAKALADPERRKILTGLGDDEFVKVGRPA